MFLSVEAGSSLVEKARRRSVDVGGLALALGVEEGNQCSGYGWGGWDEVDEEPSFAELVSKMHNDSHNVVQHGESSGLVYPEHDIRTRLIVSADSWDFEPHKLPEDELIYVAYLIFETLYRVEGVKEAVGAPIERIGDLLCTLRKVYRRRNSYHNFQHALDVLQATHHLLLSAGRVPSVSILHDSKSKWRPPKIVDSLVTYLGPLDLFCLYVASIGHDVGHPGFTNTFMTNARAPLAELYDDKSPLENLHFTLLTYALRKHDLGFLLDNLRDPHSFRKLLQSTVLATDMRVHAKFMTDFKRLVDGYETDPWTRRVLVCQAIIKFADISNPCRSLGVSQHWATALAKEWTSQTVLEQYLNMPTSLKLADDPLSEARSQVFFIETFAWPLFELIAKGINTAADYSMQCGRNLSVWKERVDTLMAASNQDMSETESVSTATPSQLPEDFLSAFPMALPSSLVHVDHNERLSHSEWASITGHGSRSSPSFASSSRSASPSPVSSTAPAPLPALSSASTSTASGSSESPHSPMLSPTEPSSFAPSRAVSIMSSNNTAGTLSTILSASCVVDSSMAAIRAAYKASVRKKPSFANRNSWSPSMRSNTQIPGVNAGVGSARIGVLGSAPTARRDVPLAVMEGDAD